MQGAVWQLVAETSISTPWDAALPLIEIIPLGNYHRHTEIYGQKYSLQHNS